MKKYLTFAKYSFLEHLHNLNDNIGIFISFVIHLFVFNSLWSFVLQGKDIAGFTKENLMWYIILGEILTYSFHHYYKTISAKVKNSDIAYDKSKPYNFMLRLIFEGVGTFPKTVVLTIIGVVFGIITVGTISIGFLQFVCIFISLVIALLILLTINIVVGLSGIWLGDDVSSLWLIVSKFMLVFVFTPLDLFPKIVQKILMFFPTTQVIYSPSKLLVHFSYDLFFRTILPYQILALTIMIVVCYFVNMKGVKKLNAYGI